MNTLHEEFVNELAKKIVMLMWDAMTMERFRLVIGWMESEDIIAMIKKLEKEMEP